MTALLSRNSVLSLDISARIRSGSRTSKLNGTLRRTGGRLAVPMLLFCAAAFASPAEAAAVTYNFSFGGANDFMPNATSTGTGFFTIGYTDVGPQPSNALIGFGFVLTLTANGSQSESSTFLYGPADAPRGASVILGGTTENPIPNQIAVLTSAITGSDNAFGSVTAFLNMGPAGGYIQTQGFSFLGDTTGPALWTSIATAPEPSIAGLWVIGLLIVLATRARSLRAPCRKLELF